MTPALHQLFAQAGVLNIAEGNGKPDLLFHGTARRFERFERERTRHELVDKFYGGGLFFVPNVDVAIDYALAARNAALPRAEILRDIGRVHPEVLPLVESLLAHGQAGTDWDAFGHIDIDLANAALDVVRHLRGPREETVFDVMHGSPVGLPPQAFADLRVLIGDRADDYRPRVYAVLGHARRPLLTQDLDEARSAEKRDYDAVVYFGEQAVRGVPEVALFSAEQVMMLSNWVVLSLAYYACVMYHS